MGSCSPDQMKKLSVSSQIPVFEYSSTVKKDINPYLYKSCIDDNTDFVITCDDVSPHVPKEVVPKAGVVLVRLTIFI